MNDLLTVIVDLNLDLMKQVNAVSLIRDVSLFLNAYQLQSGKNTYRVYVALPSDAYLIFPLEEDQFMIKKLAFGDVTQVMVTRLA